MCLRSGFWSGFCSVVLVVGYRVTPGRECTSLQLPVCFSLSDMGHGDRELLRSKTGSSPADTVRKMHSLHGNGELRWRKLANNNQTHEGFRALIPGSEGPNNNEVLI